MPFKLLQGDIVKIEADAIVNAANSKLMEGGGVCGAIFAAAGAEELRRECQRIGRCAVGGAVITKGCQLPARYIIHTVGPVWHGGTEGEERRLRSCYISSLSMAHRYGCRSIAFPLISAGIFGYPREEAMKIAFSAIEEFLQTYDSHITVYLVLFAAADYDKAVELLAERRAKGLC